MTALALTNLSKIYKNGVAGVRNLDIEVEEGELMVLVGPSGSGKSTTLRLIAGLETPSEGDIYIGGKRANDVPPRDRDIAMVFQDYALYPHLNVAQNLGFGLKMRGFPKSEISARVGQAARMLGISNLLKRRPKELSGGQRQRVALGRALVRRPKVFLFDEPLSNLDAALRVQLRREIKHIHDELGATMVYVTHDQSEAMMLGELIAVMNEGRIEQAGSPSELYLRPKSKFVAAFLGSPPINLLECDTERKGHALEIRCGGISFVVGRRPTETLDGVPRRIFLGFRPEDVRLNESPGGGSFAGAARVKAVEVMGGESLVYLEAGSVEFSARVLGYAEIEPGRQIGYRIPDEKIHLFDADTGRRIGFDIET